MSNDLESPDSPKSVIRTYSNAARREGSVRHHHPQQDNARSLRVLAINNNYKGAEAGQEIEMSDIQVADIVERRRWQSPVRLYLLFTGSPMYIDLCFINLLIY